MRISTRAPLWRDRIADWWSDAWRWLLIAAGAVLAVYLLLDRGAGDRVAAAVTLAGLVVGLVVTFSKPLAIALMAMPALFVTARVSFGAGGLSVSDVALAAAFGTAVLLGHRPYSRPLRQLLWLNLIYQFATLFTVIVNPQVENTVEWFHAWMLISGALIVGWALGRGGHASIALKLMVGTATLIAVGTVVAGVMQYAVGNFGAVYPAWPIALHKNAAGTLMTFAALILYVNPPWAKLPTRVVRIVLPLMIVAILVTQSRQALIGLVLGVIVVVARRRSTGHSALTLLFAIPAIWLVIATVIEQIESQNQHNSYFVRIEWMQEVYAFWKHAPIFGHGLRFWYYNPAVPYQPPQAEIEVAASAGLVGLAGFLIMWAGVFIVIWRLDPMYGALAMAVTLSRFAAAQFDLFWVAAQVSIPFVIAGICIGAMARASADPPGPSSASVLVRQPVPLPLAGRGG